MDTTELTAKLRAADAVEVEDVDPIVAEAIRQGRRRRVRRRAVPVLAGVTALVTAVGLAGAVALRDRGSAGPIANPTPTAGSGEIMDTDVLAVVKANLPDGMTVSEIQTLDNPDSAKQLRRTAEVTITVRDAKGLAWVQASLTKAEGDLRRQCAEDSNCQVVTAGGAAPFYEVSTKQELDGKTHFGSWTYFQRPDGLVTYFGQNNVTGPDSPVSRPDLPLTDIEVQALLTAPEWDALAPRCRPEPKQRFC